MLGESGYAGQQFPSAQTRNRASRRDLDPQGGVGKSTLAASLGVVAAETQRAALVDAHPQASLASWARKRTVAEPFVASATLRQLDDVPSLNVLITPPPSGTRDFPCCDVAFQLAVMVGATTAAHPWKL